MDNLLVGLLVGLILAIMGAIFYKLRKVEKNAYKIYDLEKRVEELEENKEV